MRLICSTGVDPIIRAQDINLDAIETLNIKSLAKSWYMVSYYWNKKDPSSLIEIPIKVQEIYGSCRIVYITPIWNGTQYGNKLLSCDKQDSTPILHKSEEVFIMSFYKTYITKYCIMPKDLDLKLALLREKYLSPNALMQCKIASEASLFDGFDLLIDNFDYDCCWNKSLQFEWLGDMCYSISYRGNGYNHKIVVSLIKNDGMYMINDIKILNPNKSINTPL